MGASSKIAVLGAAKTIFEALAPYLIESGVTSSEAISLLRAVCVHEAAKSFVQTGRRPNVSKVSIKTGVERHLVADILKTPPRLNSGASVPRNATSRVIAAWRSNRSYLQNGKPLALPVGDPRSRGRSVWKLVERYAPGVWPRLVIDELIRVDLVDVLPDGTLRCNSEHPSSNSMPLWSESSETPQLLRDAIYSQLTDTNAGGRRTSWRATQSVLIAQEKAALVRRMIRERLDSTVAELADELHSPRWKRVKDNQRGQVLIGINAFSFERIISIVDGQDSGTRNQASRRRRHRPRRGI
jgi:hypothetical protein